MTWNLEENSDDPKELQIYKYVLKRSKNPEFSKTIVRFLNLYEYIKLKNFKSASELRENILSNGKPLLTEKESEELFDMSIMRGGESKYPFLNNIFRQFLGWIYKWQPDILKDFTDNVVDIKERLQIFKHIREDYQLGEVYGLILDSITEIIPMNVTIIENIASEMPVIGTVSGLIATMISSLVIVFNNMIHFSQGDDGAIIVDSFLMIPFIGTSLHTAAISAEKQMGNLSEKRLKLIESIRGAFGEEEGQLIAQYIPDLDNLDSYQVPTLDGLQNSALSLAEKRGLPTNIESVKNMAIQHAQNINSLGTALPGSRFLDRKVVGGNPLTRGHPLKKKWGTRRKLK
jgi:hypothetical protein